MKIPVVAVGGLTSSALLAIGVTVGGFSSAAADPGDYSFLLISPNDVTDSTAYSVGAPTPNPNGQPGVTAVYAHRDGSRQITDTILVLPDPAAATAAMNSSQADLANRVANAKTQPESVGTGGTLLTGSSPDGTKSVSVLLFTQGNAATTIEFEGPSNDPVPADIVTEFGQRQDTAIKNGLAA
jgi:hypothetical protein